MRCKGRNGFMELIRIGNGVLAAAACEYGAVLQNIEYNGVRVCVGFDTLAEYERDECCFGSVVGRTANRTGEINIIDGREYRLPLNENGINHLHGGFCGFGKKHWSVSARGGDSVSFTRVSPAGEEGYPGNLDVNVTYRVEGTALIINYRATTDAPTWVSLTNHTYFNLAGVGTGDIYGHDVQINAESVSVYDKNNRVAGRMPVAGSEFDFRTPRTVQKDYDCNYYISAPAVMAYGRELSLAARASCGGIGLAVYTDMPCMQFYTGRYIPEGTVVSGGSKISRGGGLCFETQLEPGFQSRGEGVLRSGEVYDRTTVFEFFQG